LGKEELAMRPTPVEVIRGLQAALATIVLPEVGSRYAQAQILYTVMILDMLIREWEEGAQLYVDDNRGIRDLLNRGSDILRRLGQETGDSELLSLANGLRIDGAGDETSYRMADLMAESNRLREQLIKLGEVCDRARSEPRLAPLLPLWQDICAHLRSIAARRAYPVTYSATAGQG
jgi:hypothetical protein